MKKLSYSIMLMLAVAGVALMYSCGGDEGTEPEPDKSPVINVNLPANNTEVEAGAMVQFKVTCSPNSTSNTKLTKFAATKDDGTGAVPWTVFGSSSDTTISVNSTFIFDKTIAITIAVGSTVTYKFTVTDADSKTGTASVALKGKAPSTTPLATVRTGQFWHIQGACKGAFDLVTGVSKGSSDLDADKDMKNTDAVLPATFTGTWTAGNATMYVKDNAYNYAGANVEGATTKYAAGTATATVTNPVVGDIYIAKLRGGADYAVIKISANDPAVATCADGATTTNKGKVTFEYKTK